MTTGKTIQLEYGSDGEIDTDSIELTLNADSLANDMVQ